MPDQSHPTAANLSVKLASGAGDQAPGRRADDPMGGNVPADVSTMASVPWPTIEGRARAAAAAAAAAATPAPDSWHTPRPIEPCL